MVVFLGSFWRLAAQLWRPGGCGKAAFTGGDKAFQALVELFLLALFLQVLEALSQDAKTGEAKAG